MEHESDANFTPEYINEIAQLIRERQEEEKAFYKVICVVDTCIAAATLGLIAMLIF